ncbi:hypothetical protein BKA93DRAFT_501354 [Sparassis latifolia]
MTLLRLSVAYELRDVCLHHTAIVPKVGHLLSTQRCIHRPHRMQINLSMLRYVGNGVMSLYRSVSSAPNQLTNSAFHLWVLHSRDISCWCANAQTILLLRVYHLINSPRYQRTWQSLVDPYDIDDRKSSSRNPLPIQTPGMHELAGTKLKKSFVE